MRDPMQLTISRPGVCGSCWSPTTRRRDRGDGRGQPVVPIPRTSQPTGDGDEDEDARDLIQRVDARRLGDRTCLELDRTLSRARSKFCHARLNVHSHSTQVLSRSTQRSLALDPSSVTLDPSSVALDPRSVRLDPTFGLADPTFGLADSTFSGADSTFGRADPTFPGLRRRSLPETGVSAAPGRCHLCATRFNQPQTEVH